MISMPSVDLKPYLETILNERNWSWTLIAIAYLLLGLFIRSWFINPVGLKARKLEKDMHFQVKLEYLKRSMPGWFFFAAALVILVLFWQHGHWGTSLELNEISILAGSFACFVISIMLHLSAFAQAAIAVLKKASDNYKDKKVFEA